MKNAHCATLVASIRPSRSSTAERHISGTRPRVNHMPSAEGVSSLPSGASGLARTTEAISARLSPKRRTSSSMLDFIMPSNVTNNYARCNTESYCGFASASGTLQRMARGSSSNVTKAFAFRLKATRISADFLRASYLAQAIGVEAPAYRKWERGEAEPGIADLAKIQKMTGVSLDFLISGTAPVPVSLPVFPAAVVRQA